MKKTNKVNALYVHIPFCQHICHYCDFPKLQYFRLFAEKYIDSLIKEIELLVDNKDLSTIYIGGGTPTSLDDDLFEKLLSFLSNYAQKVNEYTIDNGGFWNAPYRFESYVRFVQRENCTNEWRQQMCLRLRRT